MTIIRSTSLHSSTFSKNFLGKLSPKNTIFGLQGVLHFGQKYIFPFSIPSFILLISTDVLHFGQCPVKEFP